MLQKSPKPEKKKTPTPERMMPFTARGAVIFTRMRWAVDIDGHERVFINPAGRVFRIACFKEAPGATDEGTPTEEFTWFPGYAWNLAVCLGCGVHLGWRFEGVGMPPVFFGLIKTALTQSTTGGQA